MLKCSAIVAHSPVLSYCVLRVLHAALAYDAIISVQCGVVNSAVLADISILVYCAGLVLSIDQVLCTVQSLRVVQSWCTCHLLCIMQCSCVVHAWLMANLMHSAIFMYSATIACVS